MEKVNIFSLFFILGLAALFFWVMAIFSLGVCRAFAYSHHIDLVLLNLLKFLGCTGMGLVTLGWAGLPKNRRKEK